MISKNHRFYLLLITIHHSTQSAEFLESSRPVVHTPVGCFRGIQAKDGNYSMFLGIPYAKVDPNNVFGPAIPHKFEGISDAVDDTSRCPQIEEFNHTFTGTLDCLHINIYVPNSPRNKPLPVMVLIFGGRMKFGFAGRYIYGPRFLVRHDVVFISFNYRLGPYGFLCLNNPQVPGNQGLKDQVLALRWIKANIRYFGGDDSKITVGGNSAGAISVDFHMQYLKEQLFNRAILQSGVILTKKVFKDADFNAPIHLAKRLNFTTDDVNEALAFLNEVKPYELVTGFRDSGLVLEPCVEKQFNTTESFITKHPDNIKIVKDVDVLIGFNNDEGYVAVSTIPKEKLQNDDFVSSLLDDDFQFQNESKVDGIKTIIRNFYYGDDVYDVDNRRPYMNLFSDFSISSPILRTIRKYLESGLDNIYFYIFSYSGERCFSKDKDNISYTEGGAAHADELGYLFDISYMKERLREEDMLIVDRMTELWTNFVKYGNPTPKPSKLVPLQWPRVTHNKLSYLEINTTLRLDSSPVHQRMSFLDLLYRELDDIKKQESNIYS
ncbi:acetylcholinesterase-like [Leguminivora glycinivorella]|uniref:acetylcholinesterase-like n=1 Tax=Leguminivora glycinivorella TaxID=1035111 RepID=UPI00200EF011|nr:acetylcholinesterase-like [Leguminivora glycinivorella]XP_047989470.1 acetylcholinesterase-like [Leguminivora glycinivorella]XP_047989471.1 acetylcholinesterase-like [Leguminivora glycinivorella]XP_047989472.1 acetylcholinesterase-like [Leguminivora glycinivorella]